MTATPPSRNDAPVPDPSTGSGLPVGEVLALLATGSIEVVGRLVDASNAAFLVRVCGDGRETLAIYKPVVGERPLWDFPDGTLAQREVACYLVSETGGWHVVPPTVLRDGPHGAGSVQQWIGDPDVEPEYAVDVVAPGRVRDGWLPVLRGEGSGGRPVMVVHEDSPRMAEITVFDAVINNADRKGSHLIRAGDTVIGVDHGVTLHEDDKLRTVLWGYAGQPLPTSEVTHLAALAADLAEGEQVRLALEDLLTLREVAALAERVDRLLAESAFPLPSGGWPSIPWPAI